MHHLCILSKKWKLLDRILSGQKQIESRWYVNKITPWNRIKTNDVIFFKESGDQVKAKATVKKVLQFDSLDRNKISNIIDNYGKQIAFRETNKDKLIDSHLKKNYCILIFLENVEKIKPFNINKEGYGLMSAWITLDSINHIRI